MVTVEQDQDKELMAARLRRALEMMELGHTMARQALRRKFPDATDTQLRELLSAKLYRRPGADAGDGVGVSRPLPL